MTIKEFIEENRKTLDEKFAKKYPNGKFAIQVFNGKNSLHWVPKRNTAWLSVKGISNTEENGIIIDRFYQNSSFGKVYNYDNLESLLAKAKKLGFSNELINRFAERYQKRDIK